MHFIKFAVSPYAIFDLLKALEYTKDKYRHIEYGVTKEDNDLVVWAIEHDHTEICHEPPCTNGED